MVSIHKRIAAIAAALSVTAASAGCAPDEPSGEVITITCATCQESPTDPFLQYNFEAAQRFNTAHAGEYVVETIENQNAGSSPDRLQYYKRLALADDLPDLFQLNSAEIQALQDTAKLRDFGDDLSAAPEWEETFKPDVFTALGGPDGQIWAIPQQRDAIGIYWNKALFKSVGYETFPGTWAEFEQAAAKLKQ